MSASVQLAGAPRATPAVDGVGPAAMAVADRHGVGEGQVDGDLPEAWRLTRWLLSLGALLGDRVRLGVFSDGVVLAGLV